MPLFLLPWMLGGGAILGGGTVWYLSRSRIWIYLAIALGVFLFLNSKSKK